MKNENINFQSKIAPINVGLKLDLGGGNNPKSGFESVDMFAPEATWQNNLLEFPWPWGNESVSEINCCHFIEHIPMCYINSDETITEIPKDNKSTDLLIRFFEECYRILQPNGKIYLQWPSSRSDRAFQDPTHRRFIPETGMLYLNKQWRKLVGLDYYLGNCDFVGVSGGIPEVIPVFINQELSLYSKESAERRMRESWNIINDFTCVLIKN